MINQFRVSDNRSSMKLKNSTFGLKFVSLGEYRVGFRFKEPQNVEVIKQTDVMELKENDFKDKRRGWDDIIKAGVGDELYMCVKNEGVFKGIVTSSPYIQEGGLDGKNYEDDSVFHICWKVKWDKISDITEEWDRILKPTTIRSTAFRIKENMIKTDSLGVLLTFTFLLRICIGL